MMGPQVRVLYAAPLTPKFDGAIRIDRAEWRRGMGPATLAGSSRYVRLRTYCRLWYLTQRNSLRTKPPAWAP